MLPIFFMALAGFLFYFQVMTLQLRIENGLECVGAQIASANHLETILPNLFDAGTDEEEGVLQRVKSYAGKLALSGLTGAYVKYALVDSVGQDYLDSSCIQNGSSGLVCYGTTLGAMLYLRVTYQVRIPFVPGQLGRFSVTQRLVRRVWVGISAEEEATQEAEAEETSTEAAAQQVYVTKYGQVYHLYRDCRSLKRSIHAVIYGDVGDKRNNDGAHYQPCESCIHGTANAIVYITDEGRRYHNSSSCGALLRYIEEATVDQVGSKSLCSYCRSRQKEETNGVE